MRRLALLSVLAFGLAACGGSSASKGPLTITFGFRSGTSGFSVPPSITIAPDGKVRSNTKPPVNRPALTTARERALSELVRNRFGALKSEECPGTSPGQPSTFIAALGKTVTVRGSCEPAFTKLWNALLHALFKPSQ